MIDIRNIGFSAAVEMSPIAGQPGMRALRVFEHALKNGMLFRFTGDIIAMAPPVISTQAEVERMIEVLRDAIKAVA